MTTLAQAYALSQSVTENLSAATERVAVFERAGRLSARNAAHVRRIIADVANENQRYTAQVMSEARAHLARNGMRAQGALGFPVLLALIAGLGVTAGAATVIWGWTLKNKSAEIKACTDCMEANNQNANLCQHVCGGLASGGGGDGAGTFGRIGKWAVVGVVGAIIVSKVIDKTLDQQRG